MTVKAGEKSITAKLTVKKKDEQQMVLELKTLTAISALVFLACAAAGDLPAGLVALGAYLGAALSGIAVAPLLLVTAVATSAIERTWLVRLVAIRLTLSVRSFHVPATPRTSA